MRASAFGAARDAAARQVVGLYQQAAQWIQDTGGQQLGASSLIEIGLADVLCERNDLDAALIHVKKGLALLPLWGKADDLVLAHVTMARIELAQSNIHAATEAMEKACEIIQATGVFPEAPRAAEHAQVKLWLALGDMQAASRWFAGLQKRFGPDDQFGFGNETAHIAQTRFLLAQKRNDEAIGLLSTLAECARSSGRMGRFIEIMILKALALQGVGDTEESGIALTNSLTLAEPEGYMRLFLDEGEQMSRLLKRLRISKLTPPLRDYTKRLLEAFAPGR